MQLVEPLEPREAPRLVQAALDLVRAEGGMGEEVVDAALLAVGQRWKTRDAHVGTEGPEQLGHRELRLAHLVVVHGVRVVAHDDVAAGPVELGEVGDGLTGAGPLLREVPHAAEADGGEAHHAGARRLELALGHHDGLLRVLGDFGPLHRGTQVGPRLLLARLRVALHLLRGQAVKALAGILEEAIPPEVLEGPTIDVEIRDDDAAEAGPVVRRLHGRLETMELDELRVVEQRLLELLLHFGDGQLHALGCLDLLGLGSQDCHALPFAVPAFSSRSTPRAMTSKRSPSNPWTGFVSSASFCSASWIMRRRSSVNLFSSSRR